MGLLWYCDNNLKADQIIAILFSIKDLISTLFCGRVLFSFACKKWQFYCFPNLLVRFASLSIYNGSVLSRLIFTIVTIATIQLRHLDNKGRDDKRFFLAQICMHDQKTQFYSRSTVSKSLWIWKVETIKCNKVKLGHKCLSMRQRWSNFNPLLWDGFLGV